MPAQQAFVPALVPIETLPRAPAFSSSGMQCAIVAGPAIGSFVFVARAAALYVACAALFALAAGGAADMVSIVIRQTLVQLETPDAMRGRVSAVNSVFIGARNQRGEFRVGAMAAVIGPFGAVVAGGLGTVAVAARWVRLFPALARRDRLVPAA